MFSFDVPEHRIVAVENAVEHLMNAGVVFLQTAHGFSYDTQARAKYLDTYVNAGVRLLTREA